MWIKSEGYESEPEGTYVVIRRIHPWVGNTAPIRPPIDHVQVEVGGGHR